ncbi:MAG TPA: class II fructose-bisphosphate aldolase [Gammaproteobacteria bacterium]|nr:class II fructose-bisphosphate aldolase [Gammaproteobacteria bacterium]
MPLVNMKPVLAEAKSKGYAVAAFNTVDYASTKAMIAAAEELKAPVIVQTSAKTIKYYGHDALVSWVRQLGSESPVPVVLHLDHCKDFEMIRKCVETGWTSVMIDASDQPFEKNLELSRRVVDVATKAGVAVEAEIGQILGVEDDMVVSEEESHLTDPNEAERFCRELKHLGAFAAAIGTAHGYYKGEPKVAFDRIEEINRRTGVPMALHGGTGLSDDVIQRCIKLGCSKINISTNLKHVFVDSFVEYHTKNPKDYEPLRVLGAQYDAMKQLFKEKIAQFGGTDRSAEVLAKVA